MLACMAVVKAGHVHPCPVAVTPCDPIWHMPRDGFPVKSYMHPLTLFNPLLYLIVKFYIFSINLIHIKLCNKIQTSSLLNMINVEKMWWRPQLDVCLNMWTTAMNMQLT